MMFSRLRAHKGGARYIYTVFFIIAAFALLFAPQITGAASPPGISWQGRTGNMLGMGAQLIAPLQDPPGWSASVRANTDTTANGQHEPALAVSPANPNVVVIANKDYRDSNIKRVWIEASRDGGQTWPTQLHMPNLPTTDSESDPV